MEKKKSGKIKIAAKNNDKAKNKSEKGGKMKKRMHFEILNKSNEANSRARTGLITINRFGKISEIKTPAIAIVGTRGAVKSISIRDLKEAETQIVLSNTYHLMEKAEIINAHGGLHEFMGWDGMIITDSGGFQVFSLGVAKEHQVSKIGFFPGGENIKRDERCKSKNLKITEEGVYFRSEKNGAKLFLSPEESMRIQELLNADMIFAFDECTSPLASKQYTKLAMERTNRWAVRCLDAKKSDQALFGIIQGGAYEDLRYESAEFISSLPFDGIGIGGSLGDTKEDMYKILDWLKDKMPQDAPKHLLGIGDLEGIIEAVKRGVDLFDCVAPTREARNGRMYTKNGFLNIDNAKYKNDLSPVEERCGCYVCLNHTRSYLNHLFKEKLMNAGNLASIHNIYFMNNFFKELRENIDNNNFETWSNSYLKNFKK